MNDMTHGLPYRGAVDDDEIAVLESRWKNVVLFIDEDGEAWMPCPAINQTMNDDEVQECQ